MKLKYLILLFVTISLSSCVSKQVYENLENKYNRLLKSNEELIGNNEKLVTERNKLQTELTDLETAISQLNDKKKGIENEYTAAKSRLDELISSYDALESKSSSELTAKATTIRNLLTELEEKENALMQERLRLEQLQTELTARSQTIDDLEELINAKEAKMNALRSAVSNALQSFEGKGLTVTRKNGKVYVSMENKLLFGSGSWSVGSQGKLAVEKLAQVLSKNPDIEVLIEGHTDNVPYNGTTINDNWDLSVKRATAIVRILQHKGVNPTQITAAGRSKYLPISDNTTAAGKAKNRRIEIILAPNLDQINELLEK
jgi:chemotaxis protein MotB